MGVGVCGVRGWCWSVITSSYSFEHWLWVWVGVSGVVREVWECVCY